MIRLLTCKAGDTKFRFEEYDPNDIPSYAILSHTWLHQHEDEVSYHDLKSGLGLHKPGWTKIDFCSKQALSDGFNNFWIDTCCIDKRNEPELTTSINSMFSWYQAAARCYVYLSDVTAGEEWEFPFARSRCFTRGWTLQELVAPKHVQFFTSDGTFLGNKSNLGITISRVTRIPLAVLQDACALYKCTVKERMSWAKSRKTKRREDLVYLLMGIFDVSMPVIYGEGEVKAMRRLKDEIKKSYSSEINFDLPMQSANDRLSL